MLVEYIIKQFGNIGPADTARNFQLILDAEKKNANKARITRCIRAAIYHDTPRFELTN